MVVIDLLSLLTLLFNIFSSFAREFSIGDSDYSRCVACQIIVVIHVMFNFISFYTLTLMSIDRLIYLKWPITYHKRVTKLKLIIVLLFVWILCFCYSILPIFGIGNVKYSNNLSSCSITLDGEARFGPSILIGIILSVAAFIPFVVTLAVNMKIVRIIHKSYMEQRDRKMSNRLNSLSTLYTEFDLTKIKATYHRQQIWLAQVFGALFAVNMITWIPVILSVIVLAVLSPENSPPSLFLLVTLPFLSQSAIHPMVETCMIGKVRTALRKYLRFPCDKIRLLQGQKVVSISNIHPGQTDETLTSL